MRKLSKGELDYGVAYWELHSKVSNGETLTHEESKRYEFYRDWLAYQMATRAKVVTEQGWND